MKMDSQSATDEMVASVDVNPRTHIIPTPGKGSIATKLREMNSQDSTAIHLAGRAFPWDSVYWPSLVRNLKRYYTLGVFDMEEKLLGYIAIVRDGASFYCEETRSEVERELLQGKYSSYIGSLAIHEDYRRYGLASKLMRKAIEFSKECGHELIYLHAEENNKAATKLYEKTGFTGEAVLENYFRKGDHDLESAVLYVMRL